MGERRSDVAEVARTDGRELQPVGTPSQGRAAFVPSVVAGHSSRWLTRRVLLVGWDAFGWVLALSLAWALRDLDLDEVAVRPLAAAVALAVVAQLVIAALLQTYRGRNPIGSVDEAISVATVATLVGVVVFVGALAASPPVLPRSVPLLAIPLSVLFSVGSRLAVRLHREHRYRADYSDARRVIIYGAGAEGQRLVRLMQSDPEGVYLPVALLDDKRLRRYRVSGVEVLGTRADIAAAAARSRADLLVVADRGLAPEIASEIAADARDAGLAVRVLPSLGDLLQPLTVDLTVPPPRTHPDRASDRPGHAARPVLSRSKRALDVVLSSLSVLVLLPLLLLIALLLKSTGSEVIYRAPRVGRDGRSFEMFKFATMTGASGPRVTTEGDPRITPVGRWLRASKLNELPQMFNVIKGDMSLVGPRPEDPRFTPHYSSRHRRVLAVRPGVTSRAFLRFGDEQAFIERVRPPDVEAFYVERLLPEKLDIELEYVDNWSLREDLRIMAGTVRGLLR
jgi:lipopolysaccharide/colanic/teichoic acid biosynthesis glycosyltransferase